MSILFFVPSIAFHVTRSSSVAFTAIAYISGSGSCENIQSDGDGDGAGGASDHEPRNAFAQFLSPWRLFSFGFFRECSGSCLYEILYTQGGREGGREGGEVKSILRRNLCAAEGYRSDLGNEFSQFN